MPRRQPKPPAPQLSLDWSQSARRASEIVVSRSPKQQKLEALAKEHERLLRSAAKKRAALEHMERAAGDILNDFWRRLEPLQERFEATVREIHELFERLLGPKSRLGRRSKAEVRAVYKQVTAGLPPSLRRNEPGRSTEPNGARGPGPDYAYDADLPGDSAPWTQAGDPPASESGYSAPKHSGKHATTLRELFRRLATALHPDKVQDEDERLERTAVMKNVTQAYEAGDIARLVELERTHLASVPIGDDEGALARRAKQLLQANAELRRQVRHLTLEQKRLKQSLPFPIDLRPGGAASARAAQEIDAALAEFEVELGEFVGIRDFVRQFADGEMSLKEFLEGPGSELDDLLIDAVPPQVLDAMLADVLGHFDEITSVARRKKPRPKKKGRAARRGRR